MTPRAAERARLPECGSSRLAPPPWPTVDASARGHDGVAQSRPSQPAWQSHSPGATHLPWAAHGAGHSGRSQPAPDHPGSHEQSGGVRFPPLGCAAHLPWFEHPFVQLGVAQS